MKGPLCAYMKELVLTYGTDKLGPLEKLLLPKQGGVFSASFRIVPDWTKPIGSVCLFILVFWFFF